MKYRLLAYSTAVAIGASALPAMAYAEARVLAALDPNEVTVGEPARLVIEVEGEQARAPAIPRVAGLDVIPLGTSQRVTIINGAPDFAISYRYAIVASRPGSYTIPSFTVGSARTEPVVLVARAGGASRSAPTGNAAASAKRGDDVDMRAAQPGRAFLRLILPKRRLVVGETVPVTVKAYFSPGTSAVVEGLPKLSTDAFAVHGLDSRARQTQENVRGVPYGVLTWRGRLTALMPVEQEVSAQIPTTLQYREPVRADAQRPSRRDPFGDPFALDDDPFFSGMFPDPSAVLDDFFAAAQPAREVSRRAILRDGAGAVTVTALPSQGKPAGSVAVGRFEVSSTVSPEGVTVGEPVTVRVAVTGTGTFDRVAVNGLQTTPAYRAYAPTGTFAASDTLGIAGTKTFEQSVIPNEAGDLVLPGIPFTYFDPDAGAYVTRTTEPMRVSVAPSATGETRSATLDTPAVPGLRPDRAEPGAAVSALLPVSHSMAWLALPLVLFGLAFAVPRLASRTPSEAQGRRRARRRAERRVRTALRQLESAHRGGHREAFFAAARTALQERVALRLGINAEAVTLAEIEAHPELGTEAATVFQEADRLAFSGTTASTAGAADLGDWKERVERALGETAR